MVNQLARRIVSVGIIVIVLIAGFFLGSYTTPKTTTTYSTTIHETTTTTLSTTVTLTTTSYTLTTTCQEGDTPPIVRVSDTNYWHTEPPLAFITFSRIATNSELSNQTVSWALSNRQPFIDTAVNRAIKLGLDGNNLRTIMTKLLLNISELDFYNKSRGIYFGLGKDTAHLPCLIEKAKYEGVDAWFFALNWEKTYGYTLGHFAVVIFRYGSDEVLFGASCA